MAPKPDIGWEFGHIIGDNQKIIVCKFCGKTINGGITIFKEHIALVSGNVQACYKAPKEISLMIRKHLQDSETKRNILKKKKELGLESIQQSIHGLGIESSGEDASEDIETQQLRKALKESRNTRAFEEEMRNRYDQGFIGSSSSSGLNPGLKRKMHRSLSVKEKSKLSSKGIDSFMFPSKHKSIKNWFGAEKVKGVGKAISKWFIYNAIPFNAAYSGPYYQSMINTIAEAGPGIKGPSGRQIGGVFLEEEVDEINGYLNALKSKWSKYGCTIMCDDWSTRNKHSIINFMIYCDRNRVFHSSVDCTNKSKTADFILSLMNKVIDEIGEENVVQVVTDSEGAMKAASAKLMMERPHLFWSPCAAHCLDLILEDVGKMQNVKKCIEKAKQIKSFIYNSDKVVNLMKTFTNDRELLRPGITRFATEFILIERLVRHASDLKRMCNSTEWEEINNTSRRRKEAEKIIGIIMETRFWKRARDICTAMEPLVKVLKLVDQDKKPTMSIIYEAMDRAKLAIKENTKDWQSYRDVIDDRWYNQLHQHLHVAGNNIIYMIKYKIQSMSSKSFISSIF
ncbi:uncharacterized protein LOC142531344 [Primulina tabacum]|uniref:uncharacterized protein LOC142531344 n=1 Tax=Primulina tabacum TaxID=48773 RepID=UPI003F592DD0